MTRNELIREVSLRTDYENKVCSEIIRDAFEVITRELEAYGYIKIPHFGTFDVYDKKAKIVKDLNTGELTRIEGRKYPRFTPAIKLKNRISK